MADVAAAAALPEIPSYVAHPLTACRTVGWGFVGSDSTGPCAPAGDCLSNGAIVLMPSSQGHCQSSAAGAG